MLVVLENESCLTYWLAKCQTAFSSVNIIFSCQEQGLDKTQQITLVDRVPLFYKYSLYLRNKCLNSCA